jgi:hypothetical protein
MDMKEAIEKLDKIQVACKALKAENEALKADNKSYKKINEYLKERDIDYEKEIARLKDMLSAVHIKFSPNPVSVEDIDKIFAKEINIFNHRALARIAQALHDRIYKDKPKEYCTCESGKFFHLQITLPLQDEWICKTCNKPIKNKPLAKPIKTEKKKLFCSICGYYTEYEKECGTNEKGEFICYKNGHLLKHQAERILGIKTEKIEPLEQCYNDGKHFIVTSTSAVINKLNEVIDRFNERGI